MQAAMSKNRERLFRVFEQQYYTSHSVKEKKNCTYMRAESSERDGKYAIAV